MQKREERAKPRGTHAFKEQADEKQKIPIGDSNRIVRVRVNLEENNTMETKNIYF